MKHYVFFGAANISKKTHDPSAMTTSILSSTSVRIAWTNPIGIWSGVAVERSTNNGAWGVIANVAAPAAFYDDTPGAGTLVQYRISAYTNGGWTLSNILTGNQAALPALAPVSVALAAVGFNNLRLTWAYPGGAVTSYDIDAYNTFWFSYQTTNATGTSDWATASPGYMRVRSKSPGGDSAWVQVGPVTPVAPDTTGPPAPTPTVSWNGSILGTGVFVSWAAHYDPSGNGITYLDCSFNGGAWTVVRTQNPGGPANTSAIVFTYAQRGQSVSYRIRTFDSLGNMSTSAASAAIWTRPYGTFQINPSDSCTWAGGAPGGWRGDTVVVTDLSPNNGIIFYGSRITDLTHGFTADSSTFHIRRWAGNPTSSLVLALMTEGAKAGYPVAVSININVRNFNPGDENFNGFCAMPTLFNDSLSQGGTHGIAVQWNGTDQTQLYGVAEDGQSGQITFVFV